jgi:putative FmdB family regulatory protein
MPVYEYECLKCGVHFDKLQRFGDESPSTCPNGHADVHRLFSQPTIIFKGSGFYVTDNGRNGRSATSSSSSKEKPTKQAKTEEKKAETPTTKAKSE